MLRRTPPLKADIDPHMMIPLYSYLISHPSHESSNDLHNCCFLVIKALMGDLLMLLQKHGSNESNQRNRHVDKCSKHTISRVGQNTQ